MKDFAFFFSEAFHGAKLFEAAGARPIKPDKASLKTYLSQQHVVLLMDDASWQKYHFLFSEDLLYADKSDIQSMVLVFRDERNPANDIFASKSTVNVLFFPLPPLNIVYEDASKLCEQFLSCFSETSSRRTIQTTATNQPTSVHGHCNTYEWQSLYHPFLMGGGGDVVDVIKSGQDDLCFLLADVEGHDARSTWYAWLFTLIWRISWRFERQVYEPSGIITLNPPPIHTLLSHQLTFIQQQWEALLNAPMVTLMVNYIQTKCHQMYWFNCGHLPSAILLDQVGVTHMLANSPAMGVPYSGVRTFGQAHFESGMSMVMASDGVLELLTELGLKNKLDQWTRKVTQWHRQFDAIDRLCSVGEGVMLADDLALLAVKKS